MVIRVSTPRRFILSGTKRDRPKMLLVCIPACEQGTRILSVPRIPSAQFDPVDEFDPCIPWNPALTPSLV